jgi:hypothetical protein
MSLRVNECRRFGFPGLISWINLETRGGSKDEGTAHLIQHEPTSLEAHVFDPCRLETIDDFWKSFVLRWCLLCAEATVQ